MTGYVFAVVAGIILFMFAANQNGIGYLNAHMERMGVKQKRVKEPKFFSAFIRHEDIMSVIGATGIPTHIKYDGTVYVLILVHSILSIVLCFLLVAAVIIAACVFNYLLWWALLIAVGYWVILGLTYYYYKIKTKKKNK